MKFKHQSFQTTTLSLKMMIRTPVPKTIQNPSSKTTRSIKVTAIQTYPCSSKRSTFKSFNRRKSRYPKRIIRRSGKLLSSLQMKRASFSNRSNNCRSCEISKLTLIILITSCIREDPKIVTSRNSSSRPPLKSKPEKA